MAGDDPRHQGQLLVKGAVYGDPGCLSLGMGDSRVIEGSRARNAGVGGNGGISDVGLQHTP